MRCGDSSYPPDARCETCGHRWDDHNYRHPFVTSAKPTEPWKRIEELEDRVKDLELSLLLRDDELRDAREQEEAHRRRVRELEGAINDYVANPGCNAPAKKKAIEKLMSAVMKGIK